jgi:hypothetical protein
MSQMILEYDEFCMFLLNIEVFNRLVSVSTLRVLILPVLTIILLDFWNCSNELVFSSFYQKLSSFISFYVNAFL